MRTLAERRPVDFSIMTSSPDVVQINFSFTNFEVFGSVEFNSELRFLIVYGTSLRSANVLTLPRVTSLFLVTKKRYLVSGRLKIKISFHGRFLCYSF